MHRLKLKRKPGRGRQVKVRWRRRLTFEEAAEKVFREKHELLKRLSEA